MILDREKDEIGKRLKEFRESLGLSQTDFANNIDVKQGSLASIETGRISLSTKFVRKLTNKYKIDLNWLFNGESINESKSNYANTVQSTPNLAAEPRNLVHLTSSLHKKTLLVPAKAQAGYLGEWTQEYIDENLHYLDIPGAPPESRAFEILGDSMEPILLSSDYVVCSKVENKQEIKSGLVYIVITRESGINAKYLELYHDSLLMIPANTYIYEPYTISYEEVAEIWEARFRITRSFTPPSLIHKPRSEVARIEKIEHFLNQLFPDFNSQKDD